MTPAAAPSPTARRTRVLCVDDHAFLTEGLQARLALEPDMECVGRLDRADDLVPAIERLRPDIVLMDIEMPGRDPFDAADDARRRCAGVKIVFLSAFVRDHYLSAAHKAGATGYFSKSDPPDALINGLRRVARGEFTLGPAVAERCGPPHAPPRAALAPNAGAPGAAGASASGNPTAAAVPVGKLDTLTTRELEVLRLIGRGLSRAEIAKNLSRSPKTVDGHRERIMAKLDIHSAPELVRFAIREGLAEV